MKQMFKRHGRLKVAIISKRYMCTAFNPLLLFTKTTTKCQNGPGICVCDKRFLLSPGHFLVFCLNIYNYFVSMDVIAVF